MIISNTDIKNLINDLLSVMYYADNCEWVTPPTDMITHSEAYPGSKKEKPHDLSSELEPLRMI